jgi:hypothetical protein
MNHTPNYAEIERDRQSRIENASAALLGSERKRLSDIHRQTELALARLYGGKLTPEITARLLEGQILDADVLCTVSGGLDEMPKSQETWDTYAHGLVKKDSLAQRCLDFADAKLKESFRQEALGSLNSTEKMNMASAGTLDAFLSENVARRLDDRAMR